MTRLGASMANDVRLQVRYGLYAISILMVLVWGVLLGTFARAVALRADVLVPAFIVVNLMITTFYFMAALVLLEKSEGVLAAVVTTPLRSAEYLLSKACTLTALAAAETLLIVVFIFGTDALSARLVVATALLGILYALFGFVAVVRFESINSFLMPSVPIAMFLLIPLLSHFGVVAAAVVAWHPAYPMLHLMRAGGVFALLLSLVWCVLAALWARREFRRFVVRA